jgi:hypothetical protein
MLQLTKFNVGRGWPTLVVVKMAFTASHQSPLRQNTGKIPYPSFIGVHLNVTALKIFNPYLNGYG